jgi:hypothetical protein
MADLGSQLNQLTPEQKQAVLARAQQEANAQVMQGKIFGTRFASFVRCVCPILVVGACVCLTFGCFPRQIIKRNDETYG